MPLFFISVGRHWTLRRAETAEEARAGVESELPPGDLIRFVREANQSDIDFVLEQGEAFHFTLTEKQ